MNKRCARLMGLALAGLLLCTATSQAGSFTLTLVNLDGSAVTDQITLTIKDNNGATVTITPQGGTASTSMSSNNGVFNFSIAPGTKAVSLTFTRGATTLQVPGAGCTAGSGLLGTNVRTQNIYYTIKARS